MDYWLIRGNPKQNGDFAFIRPDESGEWRTKRPPHGWNVGDRLFFWASSPRLELVALGEFQGKTGKYTDKGETLYKVRYLTSVLDHPLRHKDLKTDPALQEAIFLKNGPAASVVRLRIEEGEHLYRLVLSENPSVKGIWPSTTEASLTDVDESAIEGERQLVEHLRQERSRKLVDAKKSKVMTATGRLACEACGFDFEARYGSLGEGFCEVHHRVPLASREVPSITRLEELAIVCSNCHRIIHRAKCALSVDELQRRLAGA